MMYCPLRSESRGCDEKYCMMWVDNDCVIKKACIVIAQSNAPVKCGEI